MPAHTPRLKPHSLALALAALLPSVAFAAGQDTAHRDRHLTELSSVQVTASPLQGDAESLARPVEVLAGERLDEQKAGTLGDTVAKLPGVQSTFFGPGVGRLIIRGQKARAWPCCPTAWGTWMPPRSAPTTPPASNRSWPTRSKY